MCRSFFVIGREALAQVFSCECWSCEIYGAASLYTPWATASVTKNTGVTNKQHTITANMVDLTKSMFAFVCITMPTSNNFTSSYIVIERANADWIRSAKWNFLFENKK